MSNRPPKRANSGSAGRSSGPSRTVRPGVRGPGGPPAEGAAPAGRGAAPIPVDPAKSPARQRFERLSLPLLMALQSAPRWIVVVLLAVALFLGLIQTGPLAWVGTLLLLVVAAFLGWLLALSWPVLKPTSRALRLLVVVVLVGIAVLKAIGRF